MSAFGRKNGPGGGRSSFGVARPMKGGEKAAREESPPPPGGKQFPPLPGEEADDFVDPTGPANKDDAMTRLADRANAVHEKQEQGGFEASVHKI